MDEFEALNPGSEQEESQTEIVLATVASVGETGVTITVDGSSEAGEKEYKVNSGVLFAAGDRVKIEKNSGTYIVEYPIGNPMERYPIPTGGSDGQVLTKDGSNPYKVKWGNASHGIPSGGSSGQVLVKDSATDYDVSWKSAAIPSGGASGQVLTKNSATSYDVSWKAVTAENGLPTGGTTGQVLKKTSATNYAVEWGSVSVSSLTNGNYTLELSSSGVLAASASKRKIQLGTSSIPFNNCYIGGELHLGPSSSDKIGFFGHAVASRQTVSNTATVKTLITALKAYGLIA